MTQPYKVINSKNGNQVFFTEDEYNVIRKLIKMSLDLSRDTYSMFADISNANDIDIEKAISELIEDKDEIDLIIRLAKDTELIQRLEEAYNIKLKEL